MSKIDFHVILIAVFVFVPTIVFLSHYAWVLLPLAVVQFPVLTRWTDRRRHGDGLGYLVTNEAIMFVVAALGVVVLISK